MTTPLHSESPMSPPSPVLTSGSVPRALSDILGTTDDPSLRLVGVSVHDSEVRIKFHGADGTHITRYSTEDALRIVTELMGWSHYWNRPR